MTASRCRIIAVLMTIAVLASVADGQQQTSAHQSTTFTAPDSAFQFSYPSNPRDSQLCTKGKIQPCIGSFIPVCEEDALVCVTYAPQEFKDTSFSMASFQVREIVTAKEQMTADICVTPYPRKDAGTVTEWPEFLISAKHPVEIIGGVQFIHGINGGAATGHDFGVDLYRAFYKQRCFELSISETGTNPMISDPPMKTLTSAQQKELDQTMSDMLHSFRFTK
jgi:hypothetical protein